VDRHPGPVARAVHTGALEDLDLVARFAQQQGRRQSGEGSPDDPYPAVFIARHREQDYIAFLLGMIASYI
jgi:hypothetical protein